MDTVKLFKLKQELNAFLEAHPELKPLQLEIETELDKAGCQENRLKVISNLMMSKFFELNDALKSL